MKKFFAVVLMLAMLATLAALPVSAANMEILRGTPVIDGQIDDIYLESFSCGIFGGATPGDSWGSGAPNQVEEVQCYVLWDNNTIYVAARIYDSTINQFDYESSYASDRGMACHCDGFANVFNTADGNYFFLGVDAFGSFLIYQEPAKDSVNLDDVRYATTVDESGEFYTVEMAIPFEDGIFEGANDIGWHFCVFNTGRKNEKGGYGYLGGLEGGIFGGHKLLLSASTVSNYSEEPVTEPITEAPETDAPVTDAPVTDAPVTDAPVTDAPVTDAPATAAPATDAPETTPNPENPDAPQTADAVVIFAVVALCAAIALVVISKKRTA